MNRVKVATIFGILAAPVAALVALSIAKGEETAGAMHAHLSGCLLYTSDAADE